MTFQRIEKLQDLFIQATEVPSEQRKAWLQERCHDQASLLAELGALLAHHDREQDPLEQGIDSKLFFELDSWPTTAGYEIVREIGSGGQATVYEVIQKSTNQRTESRCTR
jgi:hypothetical protein